MFVILYYKNDIQSIIRLIVRDFNTVFMILVSYDLCDLNFKIKKKAQKKNTNILFNKLFMA